MWPVTAFELAKMAGISRLFVNEYILCRAVVPVASRVKNREELFDAETSLKLMWGDLSAAADRSITGIYARCNGLLTTADLVAFAVNLGIEEKVARQAIKQGLLPVYEQDEQNARNLYGDDALIVLRQIAREKREQAEAKARAAELDAERVENPDIDYAAVMAETGVPA